MIKLVETLAATAGFFLIPAGTRRVRNRMEFLQALSDFEPDVILADYKLPDMDGRQALSLVLQQPSPVPIILVTGALGDELAVELIKAGATDYILKDELSGLVPSVRRAMREVEQRRARATVERTLRESEERFRQMAENIREVLWMTDREKNQMIYISPGYETIWGRSCQSLYDSPRTWQDAIYPEDRERVLKAAVTKQISGEYNETYRISRPDGSMRWIQDRAFPIRDAQGTIYRIAGIAEDVTQRKQAEEALRQGQARKTAVMQASPGRDRHD